MFNDYPGPHPVQFQGRAWARWLLRCLGWRVHFDGLPARQGLLIVYPHTSNWDFVYGMLAKAAMGLPVHFWAKHSLFRFPLIDRWIGALGGIPVDRGAPGGVVQDMVARFKQFQSEGTFFWLGLSPEGTRGYRPGWRSGFYRLAMGATLPLGVGTLDYTRREIRIQHFIDLTGEPSNDYARIRAIVGHAVGHNPHQAAPIQPMPPIESQETT